VITERKRTTIATLRSRLHSQCILCGTKHPRGLRLAFNTHADGHVEAQFPCDRLYQGYTGYLHGGVIAALLDSAMTNCLFAHGRVGLTGELNVRFLKPVIVSQPAMVSARITESLGPLFYMEADIRQNGQIMAKASAKFMEASGTRVSLPGGPEGEDSCRPPPDCEARINALASVVQGADHRGQEDVLCLPPE